VLVPAVWLLANTVIGKDPVRGRSFRVLLTPLAYLPVGEPAPTKNTVLLQELASAKHRPVDFMSGTIPE
jgi:hypothetical protein